MQWCEALETEPYICLNMGTGTIEEAMNWVEYLVGKGDTYYANLRRANGRDAPYPVKLIGLGSTWAFSQRIRLVNLIRPVLTLVLAASRRDVG